VVSSKVSKRYARALFKEGKEKDKLDVLREDLLQLEKLYEKSPEFRKLVNSPVVPSKVKKESFKEIFEGKLDKITFNFIDLLISAGRENLLMDIAEYYGQILDDHYGIVRGMVYSVLPLSEDEISELKKSLEKVTGKKVILSQSRDKSLLGGFIVKIKDRVFDASLKNQLDKLGEYLVGAH
jgi:F-type H+-transporting ATPase subunit delta